MMPFAMPDWAPWWLPLAVLLPALFFGLAFLLMPFSVFGVKGRLDGIEARLDEIQAEIRMLALRLPEPGPMPVLREPEAPPPSARPRRPEPAPPPPPRYAEEPMEEEMAEEPPPQPRPRRAEPQPAPRPHIPTPPWEQGTDDEEMPPAAPAASAQPFRFQRPAAGTARPGARPPIPPAPPEPPESEQEPPVRGGRFALRRNDPDRTAADRDRGASRDTPSGGRAEPRLNWPRQN